ncbi:PREDICTED: reticulon-like protein B12 [Ipomoea nil]|uniref:reticulon-like protein B12 n=1 Tax=Ipomoea nil TaxID=35883 RepID=UPI000901FBB5|nr:PREDICTED: reticulon-like protein B12 [Ipomoea nil]
MGSSDRLFNRQRSVHQILGGGLVADVILWRIKNVTVGILVITLFAWIVFERSGYTLLSLTSSVLLLLLGILFLWAKSAALLNRPAPPLPHLYLSEERVNEAAVFIRDHINTLLSAFEDIALGRDTELFVKVGAGLLLVSVIGGLTDFLTLGYTGLLIVLTVPVLYEKYEEHIDRYVVMTYRKLRDLYLRFDAECICKTRNWIAEKKKLD